VATNISATMLARQTARQCLHRSATLFAVSEHRYMTSFYTDIECVGRYATIVHNVGIPLPDVTDIPIAGVTANCLLTASACS
jgi:hypothetical protein